MKGYDVIDTRSYIAYGIVCIVWGSTYLAIRIGVSDLPPALFAGVRFVLAGSLMLAYVILKKMVLPRTARELRVTATVGALLLFGANGLVVWSEQYIPSGLTALIISTIPIFVAIIDLLTPGGSRMSWKGWAGILLGFSGVALLVSPEAGIEGVDPRGVVGVLMAAFLWASGSVYSSRNPVSGSMMAVSALQTLAGGIALCLTGIILGELPKFHLTANGAGALIYLIFAGSILGYSSFVYIIKTMPPSKASTYSYVNPVVAVVLGALILHENITLTEVLATAVILGGVIMVQTSRFKPSPSDEKKGQSKP
ncbi:MAG: EamA family transporter [Bacillota bacterium]